VAHKWTEMDIFGQGGFHTKSQFNSSFKNFPTTTKKKKKKKQ
jgi:hypothetical protein